MSQNDSLKAVLDASAVLAYLKQEPGYEIVQSALENGAAISTVNLSEVGTKVLAMGQLFDPVVTRLLALGLFPQPFSEEDALTAASLSPKTQSLGLSLGDRACLALGLRLQLPVLTADRSWANLDLGVEVHLIR